MYCHKCGSEEKDQHCSKCGEKLEELNIIDSDLSMEERSIIREKLIGKKITYILIVAFTSIIVLSSIANVATNIINGVQDKLEEVSEQREEAKRAKEEEKQKNMTVMEKRQQYYNSVIEEYQQKSENANLYVTLIDLCEDESPELIISKYNSLTKAYKIQAVYGYQDGVGKNILNENTFENGSQHFICKNGMIKVEKNNQNGMREVQYYSLDSDSLKYDLKEKIYEMNNRCYYSSLTKSLEQEITKMEYDEFCDKHEMLTDIDWVQLSKWKDNKEGASIQTTEEDDSLMVSSTSVWFEEISRYYLALAEYKAAEKARFDCMSYAYPDVNQTLFETQYGEKAIYYAFEDLDDDGDFELILSAGYSNSVTEPIEKYEVVDAYSYDGTNLQKVFDNSTGAYQSLTNIRWRRLYEIEDLQYEDGKMIKGKLIQSSEEAVEYLLEYMERDGFEKDEVYANYQQVDNYGYRMEVHFIVTNDGGEIVEYYSVDENGSIYCHGTEDYTLKK